MIINKAILYGYNPPFLGGPQNFMSRQEDERLVKNDLLQLLLTIPGERVHRPEFGVNLRNFVFEQLTNTDITSLRIEISNAINKYEPRVTVSEITLIPDEARYGLQIKIIVYLKSNPKKELVIERFIQGARTP